jgi:tetratricopeptide (TPR) repeat protein
VRLIDAQVVSELLVSDIDTLLAREMPPAPGADDVINRLSLCLRAGRRAEAGALIDHLGQLKIDSEVSRALSEFLNGRREVELMIRLENLERDREARAIIVKPVEDSGEPRTASEARRRGERATTPAAAAVWFERALVMPFTADDVSAEKWGLAMVPDLSDAEWERGFRARVRLKLAESYRNAGDPAKAQAVLSRAATEDPSILSEYDFGDIGGAAQIASGGRQLEQRIRARERDDGNSIDYWIARARYFIRREEQSEASEAFERALRLARAEPPQRNTTRRVLSLYADYLETIGAHPQARQVFRRMLASGAFTDDEWIFDELAEHIDDDERLAADSQWIWKELQRRSDWGSAIRLLEELVRAEDWDKRAPIVTHAIAAAADVPGRILPLARALKNAGEPGASVPLFERAIAKAAASDVDPLEKELTLTRQAALRKQFAAEISQEDWRRAEQTWATLLQSSSSVVDAAVDLVSAGRAYSNLADAAGRKGDKADALRFWRAAANLDRTVDHFRLESFPLMQYRTELTEFYEQMAKRDPASWVPAAALATLSR